MASVELCVLYEMYFTTSTVEMGHACCIWSFGFGVILDLGPCAAERVYLQLSAEEYENYPPNL